MQVTTNWGIAPIGIFALRVEPKSHCRTMFAPSASTGIRLR